MNNLAGDIFLQLANVIASRQLLHLLRNQAIIDPQNPKYQSFFYPLVVETWVGFAAQVLQRLKGQQKIFPECKRRLF